MSTRTDILNAMATALTTITTISTIEVNRVTPVDLDIVSLPALFIYSGEEHRVENERQTMGYETYEWIVILEVWGNIDTNLETLLTSIHNIMFTNYQFGGKAVYSFRTGVDMQTLPEESLNAMRIEYTVVYRHIMGTP
jgi:hypothetical protein